MANIIRLGNWTRPVQLVMMANACACVRVCVWGHDGVYGLSYKSASTFSARFDPKSTDLKLAVRLKLCLDWLTREVGCILHNSLHFNESFCMVRAWAPLVCLFINLLTSFSWAGEWIHIGVVIFRPAEVSCLLRGGLNKKITFTQIFQEQLNLTK